MFDWDFLGFGRILCPDKDSNPEFWKLAECTTNWPGNRLRNVTFKVRAVQCNKPRLEDSACLPPGEKVRRGLGVNERGRMVDTWRVEWTCRQVVVHPDPQGRQDTRWPRAAKSQVKLA